MTANAKLFLGSLSDGTTTAAAIAERAIAEAARLKRPMVVHLSLLSGDAWLRERAAVVPKHVFGRGVAHSTDPDELEDDLRSEAADAGLIGRQRAARCRKVSA